MSARLRFGFSAVRMMARNVMEEAVILIGAGRMIEGILRRRATTDRRPFHELEIDWAFLKLERIALELLELGEYLPELIPEILPELAPQVARYVEAF